MKLPHVPKSSINIHISFCLSTTILSSFFRCSIIVNSFSVVSPFSTTSTCTTCSSATNLNLLRAPTAVLVPTAARSQRKSHSRSLRENFSTFGIAVPNSNSYDSDSKEVDLKTQPKELEKLTVVHLKELLREKSLKVSGRKAELIQRLLQSQKYEDQPLIITTMPRTSKRKTSGGDDDGGRTKIDNEKVSKKVGKKEDKKPNGKNKKAKVDHQRITDRDEIKKLWNAEEALKKGSYTFKIMSWNVAGLRALLRKQPDALSNLASEHKLDVICLQETKLQQSHLDDPKLNITGVLADDGFDSHFSCSTTKKGYSGTCVFVRRRDKENVADADQQAKGKKKQGKLDSFFSKKNKSFGGKDKNDNHEGKKSASIGDIDVADLIPTNVSMGMDKKEHDMEGRLITLDFPQFSIANVYVPNSGQKLERLDYRTKNWDKDFLNYMKEKEDTRDKPVIWLGDLNVAHTSKDVWNDGAKHLAKQAGVTAEERESFQQMLDYSDGSFVDAFRYLHPDAMGHYSYWSQRAGNREPNKGLRLDYFICSTSLMEDDPEKKIVVRDSYMIKDQEGSDHCPVILEIEMRK